MKVDAQSLIVMVVIGIIAGWLASLVVGGGGGLIRYRDHWVFSVPSSAVSPSMPPA